MWLDPTCNPRCFISCLSILRRWRPQKSSRRGWRSAGWWMGNFQHKISLLKGRSRWNYSKSLLFVYIEHINQTWSTKSFTVLSSCLTFRGENIFDNLATSQLFAASITAGSKLYTSSCPPKGSGLIRFRYFKSFFQGTPLNSQHRHLVHLEMARFPTSWKLGCLGLPQSPPHLRVSSRVATYLRKNPTINYPVILAILEFPKGSPFSLGKYIFIKLSLSPWQVVKKSRSLPKDVR